MTVCCTQKLECVGLIVAVMHRVKQHLTSVVVRFITCVVFFVVTCIIARTDTVGLPGRAGNRGETSESRFCCCSASFPGRFTGPVSTLSLTAGTRTDLPACLRNPTPRFFASPDRCSFNALPSPTNKSSPRMRLPGLPFFSV